MGSFPPGRHVVEVRIEDLVAKRSVARSVTVRVLPNDAQPRPPLAEIRPSNAGTLMAPLPRPPAP